MDDLVKNGCLFDLLPGTLIDTAGNNTITNNGATLTADHNGRANRGFVTNLSSSYLEVPDADNLDITGDCTILWAGVIGDRNVIANKVFISKYENIQNRWLIYQPNNTNNGLQIYFLKNNIAQLDVRTSSNTLFNTFALYAFVLKPGANAIYANGVQLPISADYNTGVYGANTGNLRIGKYLDLSVNSNVTHGKMWKFNRALTESEVKKLYNYWRSH